MDFQYLLDIGIRVQNAETSQKENLVPAEPRKLQSIVVENGAAPSSPTKLLYMNSTYHFEQKARLLALYQEGESLVAELDETIFHPQGGGQPTDKGRLEGAGLPPLEVVRVMMHKIRPGVVRHECEGDAEPWLKAVASGKAEVMCRVDEAERRMNARLHSAGHLLDVAIFALGFRWKPGKGYHFPDGPYVEYVITEEGRQLDNKDPESKQKAAAEITAKVQELSKLNNAVVISVLDGVRTVAIDGMSCPCGGTHVERTGEIGDVTVKKLQAKQGNMRVSYSVT